jgi:hypothetical protein
VREYVGDAIDVAFDPEVEAPVVVDADLPEDRGRGSWAVGQFEFLASLRFKTFHVL